MDPLSYQRDGEIYFKETSRIPFGEDLAAAEACVQRNASVFYSGKNLRAVGNGKANEAVDEQGKPNPGIVENGLLSRKAAITLSTTSTSGLISGTWFSTVYVNGCKASPQLEFYYGPGNLGRSYAQKLEVDANCIRFGIVSGDTEQPTVQENHIEIRTETPLPDYLAYECGDHAGSVVDNVAVEGDLPYWEAKLYPLFSQILFMPTELGGGEANARRHAHDNRILVKFEALAPIALVHGYADAIQFFEQHGERDGETSANAFTAPLNTRHMAYGLIRTPGSTNPERDNSPNIKPQSAWSMGRGILDESRKLARQYGSDHVSIVSHSLGAIWSRFALEQLLSQTNGDLGVLSLITIAPAHNGSVLGDIRHTTTNTEPDGTKYKLLNYPFMLRKFASTVGPADASLPDSTTWKAKEFRERHTQTLEPSITVKGLSNSIRYVTVPANYNRNRNCVVPIVNLLDNVSCHNAVNGSFDKDNECSRYKDIGEFPRELALQFRSFTIQGSRYALLIDGSESRPPNCSGPPPGPGEIVACLIDQEQERGFWDCKYPYNDFTLRTEGMYFDELFEVFAEPARQQGGTESELEPIGFDPAGRRFYYRNHSMVGDSTMAEKLFERILNADIQKSQKVE